MKTFLALSCLFLTSCSFGPHPVQNKSDIKPGQCLQGDMNPGGIARVDSITETAAGTEVTYTFSDGGEVTQITRDKVGFRSRYDQRADCAAFDKMVQDYRTYVAESRMKRLVEAVDSLERRVEALEKRKHP